MSRRGIHPLLMGLDKPAQQDEKSSTNTPNRETAETSGLESAQRKRFLRSEEEEADQQG
ncbi:MULTISPECIES: hypothetical protein [unclassified Synechococcus]|uniref:hypothetical protein n=1 Tax=unclassified Synechococcus TaxID=2626047 RepID=UPI001482C724|nr:MULTISPECIES: hypothetical protein [unclassified Synechococcus]